MYNSPSTPPCEITYVLSTLTTPIHKDNISITSNLLISKRITNRTTPISPLYFFFFKQKTAYEITRDWSSDVCSSDLMENAVTDENWKTCFCQLAPGLVLFARQWARSPADAEDIVQEAFVRFWRKHHDVTNRGLLYEIGRASCRERV